MIQGVDNQNSPGAPDSVPPPVPRPIHAHGAIGNLKTIALVALDGAIDFMCWPRFDSPSIFSALLDPQIGGHFTIAPDIEKPRVIQTYLPATNVLLTRWMGDDSSAEVLDLMAGGNDLAKGRPRLVRRVSSTRGRVTINVVCRPRFDYARVTPAASLCEEGVHFDALDAGSDALKLRLCGATTFTTDDNEARATFTLEHGESMDFVIDEQDDPVLGKQDLDVLIDGIVKLWQQWSARSTYKGRWRNNVTRSSLVLKLMTSHEYGSMVAAATFGLPEALGGSRNWDYRATWIRDASFTVYSLMRLGYQGEAMAFTKWAAERAKDCAEGSLEVMYRIDGSPMIEEEPLEHLAGYADSRPVRIGNGAAGQLQLDIYGALLDSIYLTNKYGDAISHEDWEGVSRVVDFVCKNWRAKDAGIWEARNEPQHHLHSRLMCWVAIDRALRLATKRSLNAPFATWTETRNKISEDIWATFWNKKLGHFVRAEGSNKVDGAMLMMPLVRFIGSTDPAWLATLKAISDSLADDGLMLRYNDEDGLLGKEGSFAACSFWYVECLARAGQVDKARLHFEKLLAYGNHLSLYAEEFSSRAELLGNFPQALTHLALISAAFYLDRAIEGGNGHEWRV